MKGLAARMSVPTNRERALAWLACLLVACAPLALGGVTAYTRLAIAVASIVALVVSIAVRRAVRCPSGSGVAALIFTAIPVVCILQIVPVPCSLADALGGDGRGSFVRSLASSLPHGPVPRCTLSLDPGATAGAALVAAATLASFLVGAFVTRARGSARTVVSSVVIGCALVCLVTFAHELASATTVYGLYRPRFSGFVLLGPLLNSNHLAAVACLGLLGALHVAFDVPNPAARIAALAGALVCAVTAFASRSRSGVVGVALAIGLSAFVHSTRRRKLSPGDRSLGLGVAVGLVAVLAIEVALEGDAVVADFLHSPIKTGLVLDALRLVPAAGALGFGRGAFAAGFAPHSAAHARAMSPENLVATAGLDFGPLVGFGLLAAIVVVVVRGLRPRSESPTRIAAAMAFALLVHDLADFALDFAGVSVVFGMLVGAVAANGRRRESANSTASDALRSIPVGVALAATLALAVPATRRDLTDEIERAHRAVAARDLRRADAELRAALRAHPFEPVVFLELASIAVTNHDPSAIRWANLAMRRAPAWLSPHEMLAAYFVGAGRESQAFAELVPVAAGDPVEAARFLCSIRTRPFSPTRVARLLPTGDPLDTFVHELLRCMPPGERLAILDEALAARPRDRRLASLAIETAIGVEGPDAAERRFAAANATGAPDAALLLAGARLAIFRHDGASALVRARRARALGASGFESDATIAVAAAWAGDPATSERSLERIADAVEQGDVDVADYELIRAECAEVLGRSDEAIDALDRAYAAAPSIAVARHLVALARSHGRLVRAESAAARLCHDFPGARECGRTGAGRPAVP